MTVPPEGMNRNGILHNAALSLAWRACIRICTQLTTKSIEQAKALSR